MEVVGMPIELVATAIANLGVGGIFAWLYIRKDKDKDDLVKKLLDSYNENTRVQSDVKNAIKNNTQTIREQKTLTQKIYEELIKKP